MPPTPRWSRGRPYRLAGRCPCDDTIAISFDPSLASAAYEAVRGFEEQWGDEAIAAYLDAIGPAHG